jgi:hypothetical protein
MTWLTKFFNKHGQKCLFVWAFTLFLLALVFFLTAWVSYQRIGAFGCSDQCFNFVAAYFMLKGKTLYSQIFFNHQPLMAYLSYIIQLLLRPGNLYHLVLYHRLFILFFSFLMSLLIIWRFRWAGVGFVFFYEVTKFYLYGYSFLPEAMVAYLLAYLFGLWWKKTQKEHLLLFDYPLAAFFVWAIGFLRLPYFPAAIVLYLAFLLPSARKNKRPAIFSFFLFLLLSLFTLSSLPLKEYFYDILVVNYQAALGETQNLGISNPTILKIFFYPFLILLDGENSYLRTILVGLDIVFLILIFWRILKSKKLKKALMTIFFLGLAAIRFVEPGTMFHEAFHMAPWYSLFLMAIFLLFFEASKQKLAVVLSALLAVTFAYTILSPWSFLWEKVDQQEEFTVEYADYFAYGTVIRALSKPEDTLFLDMWDDLIYWQSDLDSAYQYSLYTPIMSGFPLFRQARQKMFQNNPPDFYYSYPGASEECLPLFPRKLKDDYLQLYFSKKPTCLYLKKTKLPEITNNQWQEIEKLGFHLPED